jgi:LysM repeat protein
MENIKRVNLRMSILASIKKYGWLLACFFSIAVSAQEKLFIKGKATDRYVVYKADGKESLQSIANGFGLSVKKLSSYNKINISASKPFAKGTEIKIPVTKDNLLQHSADNTEPVVHVIGKGENLFKVSQAYNKVPLASLRSWNKLKKDVVKNGQELVIGYMMNAKQTVVAENKQEVKKEETSVAVNKPQETESKLDPKKDISAMASGVQTTPPAADKIYTEKKTPASPGPVKNDAVVNVPREERTPPKAAEKKAGVETNTEYVPKEGDEGFFAVDYAAHPKEQSQQFRSGDAAVFKTISGWTDRKFYVLMNDVAPKTIVRITGTANKSICAMVLGPLQETKGANGLTLRLSNSAASALGLNGEKFTVTVTYFE